MLSIVATPDELLQTLAVPEACGQSSTGYKLTGNTDADLRGNRCLMHSTLGVTMVLAVAIVLTVLGALAIWIRGPEEDAPRPAGRLVD